MLETSVHKINPAVLEFVEENKDKLTLDVSSYAKGRRRAWLGVEPSLSATGPFMPAAFGYDSKLWKWLVNFCRTNLNFEPEVALLHVGGADCSDPSERPTNGPGGECGIREHRDASYADYRAVGINLCGKATFVYRPEMPGMCWAPDPVRRPDPIYVPMTAGTCVTFNCKNPHFAEVGPSRWCINAWRISAKRRADFSAFINTIR